MLIDDIIYVVCLLACIGAGNYFRKIPDETQRKFLGTIFGVLMVFIVSGWHAFHCFTSAAIGAVAVIYVHPSKCHIAGFIVMFGYLLVFRIVGAFGFPDPPGPTNMIQMILTMKVAGVGFEKTAAWKKLQQRAKEEADKKPTGEDGQLVEITDYEVEIQTINIVEIFHYSFNYIGVLTGPYYRYRTYRDYFDTPFKDYGPNLEATIQRLKTAGVCCSIYLVTNFFYPLSYALSDEFYNQRSFFYRLMYLWPTYLAFRMRLFTGMTLSECVCTMAGFGAYPNESDVNNGEGPRKQYQHLKRDAEKRSYNFTTIENIRVMDTETCHTFRGIMKPWNICIQYWLAVNVYKLFPNKKYRIVATFLCSAYWHGIRPGNYMCIVGGAFYIIIEDVWNKLVRKNAIGLKRRIIDAIFWFSKTFALSYLGMAFILSSFGTIWRYYSSVYHIGYICWAIMTALGLYLTRQNKAAEKIRKSSEQKQLLGEPANQPKAKVQ